jgi:putative aldouronate transport system substrate-binding protein
MKPGIRKHKEKVVPCLLVTMLMAGIVSGCSQGTQDAKGTQSDAKGVQKTSEKAANQPVALSYYVAMPSDTARSLKNYNESMFYQELEKRTKVKVDFRHPAIGAETEQFNLMIASGNLPDIIEHNFTAYPGGPEKALSDKVIIPLNDLINKHAPNLKKFLDQNPLIMKQLTTDNGTLYTMPAVGVGQLNIVSSGLMIRQDWLKELGLVSPVTIEDWTRVLREFKNKKGIKTPLSFSKNDFNSDAFNGAFGVGTEFFQTNGKVKYGPIEPGFKEYLQLLNSWYKEGLLDPDFPTQDTKTLDTKVINGQTGAFRSAIGSGMNKYIPAGKEKNPAFDLIGAQYPVLKAGEDPYFINRLVEYRGNGAAAITPNNKHPEESIKWLDYLYSDEGNMLKTFGIEGVTYNNVNGFPKYSDLIMKNPDKLSIGEALSKYTRATQPSPGFVGDDRFNEQNYSHPEQIATAKIFSKYEKNALKVLLPRVSATPEEANELSTILAEVNTYKSEMFLKFVLGAEPLDNFDKYTAQLEKMKIKRAIELKQASLDRYNNKK